MPKTPLTWSAVALLTSTCWSQQFGLHVIEAAAGQVGTAVADLSQDGRVSLIVRQFPPDFRIESYVRRDGGIESPIPTTPGQTGSFIKMSGDGSVFAGLQPIPNSPIGSGYSIIRRRNGVTEQLTTTRSRLYTVNGDGDVITGGELYPISLGDRAVAFRWTPAGKQYIVSPNDPVVMHSEVFGSSADGRKLCGGISTWGFEDYAFAWSEQAGVQRLQLPASTFSSAALDMSSDGRRIVGIAYAGDAAVNLMWLDGVMNVIGQAPDFGVATHVSNSGVVVFESSASVISVWTQANGMMLFHDYLAQWGVSAPTNLSNPRIVAISDDGNTIAGSGTLPNGESRGFIVTVPAPGFVSVCLVSFAACRRKR